MENVNIKYIIVAMVSVILIVVLAQPIFNAVENIDPEKSSVNETPSYINSTGYEVNLIDECSRDYDLYKAYAWVDNNFIEIEDSPLIQSTAEVNTLTFSSNNNYIAYGGDDENVYLHNTNNWSLIETFNTQESIRAIDFSQNNDYIAYTGWSTDGNIYIRNTDNWSLMETLTDGENYMYALEFSPDNKYLASAGAVAPSGGKVYIHNMTGWSYELNISIANRVNTLTFSPNGSYLAVGEEGNVHIYDTNNWSLIKTLTEPTNDVQSIDFSFNGNYIAYGGNDDNVYIHNTNDWSNIQNLTASSQSVYSVKFSPDNEFIVYGSLDNNVYIHNIDDWSLIETLTKSSEEVSSIDFSPDNEYISYGSWDNNVYVHNVYNVDFISVPSTDYLINDNGIVYNDTTTEYDNTSLSYNCKTPTPVWVPSIFYIIIGASIIFLVWRAFGK